MLIDYPIFINTSFGQDSNKNIWFHSNRGHRYFVNRTFLAPCKCVHELLANKPLEILFTTSPTVKMKLHNGMDTRFATRRPIICWTIIGDMVARICEPLKLVVHQATATIIRKPRTEATVLSFVAPNKEITSPTLSTQ